MKILIRQKTKVIVTEALYVISLLTISFLMKRSLYFACYGKNPENLQARLASSALFYISVELKVIEYVGYIHN